MIINRQFFKETLKTASAATIILICIFLVISLVRILREAAKGGIPVDSIISLLSLKLLTYFDIILPIVMFLSVLMVLNRWNRDNEMTVISAAGISLANFLKPGILVVILFSMLTAWFTLDISPWAVRASEEIKQEFVQRQDISGASVGVFNELDKGNGVYFLESKDKEDGTYKDVFSYGTDQFYQYVVSGHRAFKNHDEELDGDFLVIKNGTRYDVKPGDEGYRIIDFESYGIKITPPTKVEVKIPVKGWRTNDLFGQTHPRLEAELVWRFSKIFALPAIFVFALAFSKVDPRGGRTGNLLIAFITYFVYTNATSFVYALLKKDSIDSSAPLWWMHIGFLILGLYLLIQSSNNRRFIRLR